MKSICVSQKGLESPPTATKEAFRRMVFNVIGKNCDDHIKNFSFLMNDAGEWRLSPAYDLLYSFGPVNYGNHKMSINGKNSHIALADIAQCGYAAGIEKRFMVETIEDINSIFSTLTTKIKGLELSKGLVEEIAREVKPISIPGFPKSKRGRRS